MATPIKRNRRDFPFTNALPRDEQGRISPEVAYYRAELERLHRFMQEELSRSFDQLALKIAEVEDQLPP